jgi:hypothetical protein
MYETGGPFLVLIGTTFILMAMLACRRDCRAWNAWKRWQEAVMFMTS